MDFKLLTQCMLGGHDFLIGLDEVGRGSVAGPVTVGLVALPASWPELTYFAGGNYASFPEFRFVRDSKRLKVAKRRRVCDLVQAHNLPGMTLSADNQLIDRFGIGFCLSHLMHLGYAAMAGVLPEGVRLQMIADGKIKILKYLESGLVYELILQNQSLANLEPGLDNQLIHRENFADDKYLAVALASNLAKVWRDDHMTHLHQLYPEYGWAGNKGYATADHLRAIRHASQNEFLRQSFLSRQIQPESLFDSVDA